MNVPSIATLVTDALLVSCIGASAMKTEEPTATSRTVEIPNAEAAANPWDREVFFGEQHMHTRNSFDAFTVGVTKTWEGAYAIGCLAAFWTIERVVSSIA